MKITVDKSKCVGCRTCEILCSFYREKVSCPEHSLIKIVFEDDGGLDVAISPDCDCDCDCDCSADPLCARFCPTRAIEIQRGSL